ncbi:hypothetical protein [Polyangium aurulentum]|uniref:hypothetical protein n=1 Tax=Polyangium aurulentum TaxID=2567896 RepID=UPI0010AE8D05|nr:hypothetical protein [Polyangium aurulentum]UQA59180.1 hypothetical protein E8A73_001280 [Polyangium aurulentum]
MENDPRNRRPSNAKGWAKAWSIKKSEAKAVLAEGTWTLDPENSIISSSAYVSDQGELLLYRERGRSLLYASRKELMEKMEESSKRPRSTHVLEGLLPQGPHFIEAVPALIDELAQHLKLPRESLDGSFDSLYPVEAALNKIRPRQRILEIPNLFAAIVAYTGEVMRKETDGYWKLNEVAGGIYEPYVHPANGDFSDYMNPFLEPYKAIAERKRGGLCLAAVVSAQLPGRGLKFV